MGKLHTLLESISESTGHAAAAEDALTSAFDELMAASIPTRTACALIRRSRATHYRHQQPPISRPQKASHNPGQWSGAHRRRTGSRAYGHQLRQVF